MMQVGVVGFGYWGPNLARNFFAADEANLSVICDLEEKNRKRAGQLFPGIETTADFQSVVENSALDVVVIATPVHTHYDLAKKALESGKHVWLEKPMTQTADQAQELVELAEKRNLILHVDHTFVYTGAVRKMQELVSAGTLGTLQYYDSTRINLGLFQHDVDVIWDLALHDFTILDHITKERPTAISANGMSHVADTPENIAYITLFYDSGLIAHVNVNWLSPVKIRRSILSGDRKMIVFDDLQPMEKIKVYDMGIDVIQDPTQIYNMRIGYRVGDMWSPCIDSTEALKTEVDHFLAHIQSGTPTQTDGQSGLRVVRWLEAATASMKQRGTPVSLIHE
jgi:predicted dehydrogenase